MKRDKITVFLADLYYITDSMSDRTAVPIPLGIGYLAEYLDASFPDIFEFYLFKDPERLWTSLNTMVADIIGFSSYAWNHNLSHEFMKHVKRQSPDTITLMGGPNFTVDDVEWVEEYMPQKPWLDFFLFGEGEYSIREFISLYLENGPNIDLLKTIGSDGSVTINPNSGEVQIFSEKGKRAQMPDLDEIPSPYLSGRLDEFLLDARYAPVIETNRGCPFSCAFCNWGNATKSKVREFNLDRLTSEFHYLGENNVSKSPLLYIGDANFGIKNRDVEIAHEIRGVADKYGWPGQLYLYFTKNSSKRVIDIAEILKDLLGGIALSFQSLSDQSLELIKRQNIHLDDYFELMDYSFSKGQKPYTQLIYPLPGETYESFTNGLRKLLDKNVFNISMIPLRLEYGTELSMYSKRREFGMVSKYRVISQSFGTFGQGAINAVEYEDIAIKTTHISELEYLRLRFIHGLLFVFGQTPIYRDLLEYMSREGLSIKNFIWSVLEKTELMQPTVQEVFGLFQQESTDELLDNAPTAWSREIVGSLQGKEISLNISLLIRLLYSNNVFSDFNEYVSCRAFELDGIDSDRKSELDCLFRVAAEKIYGFEGSDMKKILYLDYDYVNWCKDKNKSPLRKYWWEGTKKKYCLEKSQKIIDLYAEFCEEYLDVDKVNKLYHFQRANEKHGSSFDIFMYENMKSA